MVDSHFVTRENEPPAILAIFLAYHSLSFLPKFMEMFNFSGTQRELRFRIVCSKIITASNISL